MPAFRKNDNNSNIVECGVGGAIDGLLNRKID